VKLLDRLFLVIFARCRREDSNLDLAWRAARNKMFGYMVLPVITFTGILSVVTYALIREGTPAYRKSLTQLVAILIWLVFAFLLNRRLGRYLRVPPALTVEESLAETHLVRRFRVASVGFFVLTCLAAFVQHQFQFGVSAH
jgi:hypothetical protein